MRYFWQTWQLVDPLPGGRRPASPSDGRTVREARIRRRETTETPWQEFGV
jgi:hypothetical protein